MRARVFAILLLPLPVVPLRAQHWPSPVAVHASAPAAQSRTPARFAMSVASDGEGEREEANQILAMLFTLGAGAIGAVSGGIFDDACFGNAEEMAARATVAGLAVGLTVAIVTDLIPSARKRDSARVVQPVAAESDSARRARERREDRAMPVVMTLGGAALGAIIGAPVGASRGIKQGARCHGGTGGATLAATGQMAVAGAVTGAGVIVIGELSDLWAWGMAR